MKLSRQILLHRTIFSLIFLFSIFYATAQTSDSTAIATTLPNFDYNSPKKYVIGDVTITGVKYYSTSQILSYAGIAIGDTIYVPSDDLSQVVRKLWNWRYFSDIELNATKIIGDKIYLEIVLTERPRVSVWEITGVKKSQREDLISRLNLQRGSEYSEYKIATSIESIKKYYSEKGYRNAEVAVLQTTDTTINNAIKVTFEIDRKKKVLIKEIDFDGNSELSNRKLARSMKKTNANTIWNIFKSKKFSEEEFENDKTNILTKYNELGFRDARVVADSVYAINDKRLGVKLTVDEGKQYYFRNISWVGNTKLPTEALQNTLGIQKGDIYDRVLLEKMLNSADPRSVRTWYADNGYLFFNIDPVEVNVVADSVDLEIRLFEGNQATLNRVVINGNTRTNEHVIRRELWTKPGTLFSQSALERSIRELATSQNYDVEKLTSYGEGFNIIPNERDGTVDVIYNLTEKPNDQFELSGGFGGNTFVGTIGVRFSNFSLRRMFKKGAWRPVPSGDGQSLALRLQVQGTYYQALSVSFTEPWLGGKKPTSLSVSAYYTRETNANYYFQSVSQWMETIGLSAGIGTRLKWPDSFFQLYNEVNLQRYQLHNWPESYYGFSDGTSHNISWRAILSRVSTDQPFYPRRGSDFSISLQMTPPYSLFRSSNTNYQAMTPADRYQWIEYHKWTFKGSLYTKLFGDFVLFTRAQFGYLGYYNANLGYSPFEGFILGGDGMAGFNRYGQENIALRGYANSSITPIENGAYAGRVYDKFTIELRHPVIMEQSASIYACVFFEGGNAWSDMKRFNPFAIKRAAGVGVKVMLPIVGILGIDWGYGFDEIKGNPSANGGNFAFTFGMQF